MTAAEVEAKLREKHAYEVRYYQPADNLLIAAADALAVQAVELERMREAAREAGWALSGVVDEIAWEKRTQVQGIIERLGQALVKAG